MTAAIHDTLKIDMIKDCMRPILIWRQTHCDCVHSWRQGSWDHLWSWDVARLRVDANAGPMTLWEWLQQNREKRIDKETSRFFLTIFVKYLYICVVFAFHKIFFFVAQCCIYLFIASCELKFYILVIIHVEYYVLPQNSCYMFLLCFFFGKT